MIQNPKKQFNYRKHLFVFLITLIVFGFGFGLSDYISQKKLSELNNLREDLQLDILSAETQFSILETAICQNVNHSSLTSELYAIGERTAYMEEALGHENPQVIRLKKNYSLLEIKNWLLTEKAKDQCQAKLIPILYFYSNHEDCPTCAKQGYVLTYLREKYPFLRIYSFDYNLELSALDTIKSLYRLTDPLPILVIGENTYSGFRDKEEIENILPEIFKELIEKEGNGQTESVDESSLEEEK
jgi:hypothetical protein